MPPYRTLPVVVLLSLLTLTVTASATCSLPTSPGVSICSPADGQAVNYPAEITAAALGSAAITKMAVYVDGARIYFGDGDRLDVIDGGVTEGAHRLTVRAWDKGGNVYSSTRHFLVIGGGTAQCRLNSPGVNFCSPAIGSIQPMNDIAVIVGAMGDGARITRLKVFFDGTLIGDTTSSLLSLQAGTGSAAVHTMTAKAWDAEGHTFSQTTIFKTYYSGICSPKGCDPGVFIQSPGDGATVGSSFGLSAEVRGNPAPINAMKAYLDGQQVAASGGPTITAEISVTPGSHRLTVQAWDSKGSLYRTVYYIQGD